MVQLDPLFLPQLLYEIAVELLLVAGAFQCLPYQINLMHIKLHIVSAPDDGEYRHRPVGILLRG